MAANFFRALYTGYLCMNKLKNCPYVLYYHDQIYTPPHAYTVECTMHTNANNRFLLLFITYENEHLFGVYASDMLFAHSRFPVCLHERPGG